MIKTMSTTWAGHVALVAEKRNACRILVGKSEGKSHRWVDNIKINLSNIGWDCMDWIDLNEDRDQWMPLMSTVINIWAP
jgi:hypothetical protein